MFKKALSMVLLGILLVGGLTIAYGTFYDSGFASSVSGMFGAGENEDDEDDEYEEREEYDDDD